MAYRATSLPLVLLGGATVGLLAGCSPAADSDADAITLHAIELGERHRGEQRALAPALRHLEARAAVSVH